jgi:recombination protein RecR
MSEISYITPLERLAKHFRSLPGIGKKSAYRLAFHVLELSDEQAKDFADAIISAKKGVTRCKICQNVSEGEVCPVCLDARRDEKTVCVVENPRDVGAVERISEYRGVFHVLYGVISPLDGKTPEMLTISPLVERVKALCDKYDPSEIEIIIATNPSVEGDATAMYISRLLGPFGVKISRLAYGIPVGGDLEYADELTLSRAIEGRNLI